MDRFILKPFASSATNSGVFGSFMAGSPTTSNDPDTIQSLPAWDEGWASAVTLQGKFPKLEEMQGLQYVISKAVKELYKEGIPVWDADEDYYQYSIVSYTPTGETAPKLYYNLTGTYTSTNPADDTTNWDELTTGGGQGMPIGSIYPLTCAAGYVPEGSLPCDGTEYSKSQFNDLWTNYLTGGTPLLNTCSYADYASDISAKGFCDKWAVDTVGETFKVPTINNKFYQGYSNTLAVKGNGKGLMFTNGTSNAYMTDGNVYNANGLKIEDNARTSVAAVGSSASNTVYGGALGFSNVIGVTTNSSLSGLVAENNIKEATNLKYFVVVADGSINQSMMDWAAWASSLAGKANVGLDNVSAAGKNTAFEWGVPDYTSGVSKSTSGFTATQNGFVQALLSAYGAGNYAEILINGVIAYRANSSIITDFAPIVSGDIITVNTGGTGQVNAMTFFPIRGAS